MSLPRVGISACLLGQPVRYDGRDKRSAFLVETLGPHVAWVPVCPELEVGMGVPREPVRLVKRGDRLGMYGTTSARDWTPAMEAFAAERVERLASADLCGYVLKARSPSCGLGAPRFTEMSNVPMDEGPGLFAATLCRRLSPLPVVEETALDQTGTREAFLTALFAHHRLQVFWASSWTTGDLRAFHADHETLLFAHHPSGQRALEGLLNDARLSIGDLKARYHATFLKTLAYGASEQAHAHALERLATHLSARLEAPAQAQLAEAIADFRAGRVSRKRPLILLREFARQYGLTYVLQQHYLSPFPDSLIAAV